MGLNVNIYNAVAFNVAWLLCVLGGSYVALFAVAVTLWFHIKVVSGDLQELTLVFQVVVLGLVVDSLVILAGVLVPPGGTFVYPLWLLCLWAAFATTLGHCLKWFQAHLNIAAVAGAIFGTLSYVAGARMSDFSLADSLWYSLAGLAMVWALVFPTCLWLARRYQMRAPVAQKVLF